ncbi:PPE domain-containing protein [Mycobacterium branderi]|uniref:PPE domain-containing protein n=1 Tax=Mycobacterium branderi TaxID=43348 RepID=A0A7I7WET6_9MYCO|nr:PPE domain-containing protein [Mycobacterium branderi]MCV7235252.1 PPE domain-containing protein [Mycobacterium branderi]ORA29853.1 hypothetical protein BST20_27750 [Mycobacterium branderi]BBZ15023.1 hypothetical protein MBRA_52180 [Mycobacterium branderi]
MTLYGDSAANPPEVNYYTLTAGDHAVSAAAAAAGHQALADMLTSEMAMMGVNAASTAAGGWQGIGGAAMVMSAAQFVEVMGLAVAWLQEASMTAGEIVEAYQAAFEGMVPGPVSDTNRATQFALVQTNFIGQNTPAIVALDGDYYGHHWPTNASWMASFEAVVSAALPVLATPAPFLPTASNPAAPAAGVGAAAAQAGASAGMQASTQAMTQSATAVGPASEAAGTPASSATEMTSFLGQGMSMIGELPQAAGQIPQTLGQLPQLAGSLPQMASGLLGPLQTMGAGLGAQNVAEPAAALSSEAALASAGAGTGAGAGGGGAGFGGASLASTFTRPVSSFSTPAQPKLPGGWTGGPTAPEPVAAGAQPSGMGGGGLYGAPAAMGREGGASSEKPPTRTMQITARPAVDRGDRQRN